jgi:uncharacterized lipoprotein YddW (UPF0748 family)/N-acetylmuramoyl-L-alanine amidase
MALGLFPGVMSLRASANAGGPAGEFRGVWVASVINLDYPSRQGLSEAALKREADSILDGALEMGFNAVILQVRPASDALYSSSLFPWSEVITGEQGASPPGGFDPLAYFTEGAHRRGMELHAWLNPYRAARNVSNADGLCESNPARANPHWTIPHSDGHLYYDPGVPEVHELILSGIREIVENYAVDGIHFDDYFYPGRSFNDDGSFSKYGAGFSNKDEWRRANLDRLIRESQALVHSIDPNCRFGVAPQAIWANRANNPLGSDTRGFETLYEQFADTRKWVLEGWVDYIAPQIYWEIGRENSDYSKVLAWWSELVRGTNVDLYTGHATYLMNGNSARAAWADTREIPRQIAENRNHPAVKGTIHFRYRLIAEDAAIAAAVREIHSVTATPSSSPIRIVMPAPPPAVFAVGRPNRDVTYDGDHYYFTGASDPGRPLTVNGTEITERTPQGYFSYYAALQRGANTFTFAQGEEVITRTVTVPSGAAAVQPKLMDSADIEPGAFPSLHSEIRPPGSTVTLVCTAPIGADVTVRIGGQILHMTPDSASRPSEGGYYATLYKASYTFPEISSANSPILTIGTPVYTMTIDGTTVSRAAAGSLKISTEASKLTAEVRSASAFVFPGPTTSGGPAGELSRGQSGTVTARQGGLWVGLESGFWVLNSDVRLGVRDAQLRGTVTAAEYLAGERWDTLTVVTDAHTEALAAWNGKELSFTVFSSSAAPPVSLPNGAVIEKAEASFSGSTAVYTLTPQAGTAIDGYYIEPAAEGLRLHIKRKPYAGTGSAPLEGFTIVVDAGHGGDETGAHSPHGTEYAEKHINLYAALKLRSVLNDMGANVILTRSSDITTSLQSRLDESRSARPDLFVSLHCNSMGESVDSDPIRGVTLFYREEGSRGFSEHIYDHLREALGVQGRGVHQANFYVCRGHWSPSVLIEMGFINNPFDYEWLICDEEQNRLIMAIADGILRYFSY